jgi:hypothetical protein
MSRVNLLEPDHTPNCPPDCSERFWARVDADALIVVVVLAPDGRVLGTFSQRELAARFAIGTGMVCTLIPQALDTPEWGNVPLH